MSNVFPRHYGQAFLAQYAVLYWQMSQNLTCNSVNDQQRKAGSQATLIANEILRPDTQIIGAAIKIHRRLGPGLLESAYEACLAHELQLAGLRIERQKAVPLFYKTVKLDCGFRADLVVEDRVVVELKCKDALHPVRRSPTPSHLGLLNIPVGLLINFHVGLLKGGIRRMVNSYREETLLEEKLLTAKFAR